MIFQTLVFLIFLYGAETWTIKKADRKTIDAFELWCWRKLLGVTYLDRKRNNYIIDIIQHKRTLESSIVKAVLSFFGHVVISDMMELQMMLEEWKVARKRQTTLHKARQLYINIQNYLSKDIMSL